MPPDTTRTGPPRPVGGPPIGWRVALFLGVVVFLVWLTNIPSGKRFIAAPVTKASVRASSLLINLFGGDVRADGGMLYSTMAALDVKDGCNGIIAMILFVGAVVAHQATAGAKVRGLAFGLPAIWILNLVRLATLYAVAVTAPARLEFFHVFFWQTLIIILVAILWYFWAEWALRCEARHRIEAPHGGG